MDQKKPKSQRPDDEKRPASGTKKPAQNQKPSRPNRSGGAAPKKRSASGQKPAPKHNPSAASAPAPRKKPQEPPEKQLPPKEKPLPPAPDAPHKETDTEILRKPPTGTPEYPYYGGRFSPLKIRKHAGLRRAISILLTTIMSLFLICVITGTIVATALTVYVMNFRDEVSSVTIEELKLQYNTYVYATDADGQQVCLYEVNNSSERVPVTIDNIPQHVRDAFVNAEDGKFYIHDGVDYKRTFYSFANMFLHIYDTNIGGSTITQQLIKNITGDDVQSPSRKIREIFRAMELEKNYSKDTILESYLNYIGFGGPTNGIQGASLKYFGKSVSELSIAEAACLAAIPKSPEVINPFAGYIDDETNEFVNTGKEKNRTRQLYVLEQMYENGAITYDEYQEAVNEHLVFKDSDEYAQEHPNEENDAYASTTAKSWVVDAAIYEVAGYLREMYNISSEEAIARINNGGYQIYTTVDLDMQNFVENKYKNLDNLMPSTEVALYTDANGDGQYTIEEIQYPESAFVAMNYDGSIRAIVGSVGEKTNDLVWNYATMEPRQPGSTIKPLTTYGLGLEADKIHWGSMFQDAPVDKVKGEDWPINYGLDNVSGNYSYLEVPAYDALARSLNTVSARICKELSPQSVFNFATEKMGLKLDENSPDGLTDNALSPLSVGALTYGITLENLVNGYIPYGNGGTYYNAHIVSKVVQGTETVVYEDDGSPRRVVSEETAYVMNRMLQNVVENGTGTPAKLTNKHVAGKTGTAENWTDLSFVGMTEDFVSGVWIGYNDRSSLPSSLKAAQVWYNIIGSYADSIRSDAAYPECDTIVTGNICKKTGKIAGMNCASAGTGYWKSSNAPMCDGNHASYYPTTTTTTNSTQDYNFYPGFDLSGTATSDGSGTDYDYGSGTTDWGWSDTTSTDSGSDTSSGTSSGSDDSSSTYGPVEPAA